jgi:hypothetical protein
MKENWWGGRADLTKEAWRGRVHQVAPSLRNCDTIAGFRYDVPTATKILTNERDF